ncbi:carbohydrate kinase family protein [Nocardioides sp.]|uniref:carbohydrate kinase family protein n=1 Tax=Nocardioides sp. TaxID=35761 RepID=UPI003D14831D
MSRILVVGDVIDDIGVRPLTAVTPSSDTRSEIRMSAGGSAANVAAWLGHLGADVVFVGRAGADGVERHTAALNRSGVEAIIAGDPELPTATLVLTLDPAGERTMYVDRAANSRISMDDVPEHAWSEVDWLHLTGYTFFDPSTRQFALALVEESARRGVGLSVDPSTVSFLREVGPARFLDWTRSAELLFPNADEADLLGLDDDPRAVVTLGAGGVRVAGEVQAAHPAVVLDSTGAGDAFCAGYLAARARGPHVAVGSGLAAAAACVCVRGARPDPP